MSRHLADAYVYVLLGALLLVGVLLVLEARSRRKRGRGGKT